MPSSYLWFRRDETGYFEEVERLGKNIGTEEMDEIPINRETLVEKITQFQKKYS